jgi:hypothetical protein
MTLTFTPRFKALTEREWIRVYGHPTAELRGLLDATLPVAGGGSRGRVCH